MAGGAHGIRSFVAGRENTRSQDFSMENFLPNFLHIFSVVLKYTDPLGWRALAYQSCSPRWSYEC